MFGELPSDFLRIQLVESQVYDPFLAQQENYQNQNFLGHFTLTIAEVIICNTKMKNNAYLSFLLRLN